MTDREKLIWDINQVLNRVPLGPGWENRWIEAIADWHKSEVEEKLRPIKDAFIHGEEDFATATYDYPSIQDLYLAIRKVCGKEHQEILKK